MISIKSLISAPWLVYNQLILLLLKLLYRQYIMDDIIIYLLLLVLGYILYKLYNIIENTSKHKSPNKNNKELNEIVNKEKRDYHIIDRLDNFDNYCIDNPSTIQNYDVESEIQSYKDDDCYKPIKTRKQFNTEYFKFRDKIHDSSSTRVDPVDKILEMQSSDKYKNMKIKDIYDELTKPTNYEDMKNYKPNNVKPNHDILPECTSYTMLS